MNNGWICPRCGCGVAPSVTRCPCVDAPPQTVYPMYPLNPVWPGGVYPTWYMNPVWCATTTDTKPPEVT